MNILQRRGLVDVYEFNKRWSKKIQLLANGRPLTLEEHDINKVLQDANSPLKVSGPCRSYATLRD